MPIWQFFEKTISAPSSPPASKTKERLIVPTIVVTPVVEDEIKYEQDPFDFTDSLKGFEAPSSTDAAKPVIVDVRTTPLPTPPASPPARTKDYHDAMGLGITGVEVEEQVEDGASKADNRRDPLSEVDDLLEILGLSIDEERDEVEDEVEILLREMDTHASKLVEKSKAQFLELSREWKDVLEREYLPAKREAKLIISESYAMEQFEKRQARKSSETPSSSKEEANSTDQHDNDEKLFSAIVLADVANPACHAAFEAIQKIYNLQTLAQTKYATRLKDHKVLPLATYRRYVRRVKRTEREMEGWLRKQGACGRILEVGKRILS